MLVNEFLLGTPSRWVRVGVMRGFCHRDVYVDANETRKETKFDRKALKES
jgi:hypothetical protein